MSYFDIVKCHSLNNHLIFVRQHCLVFLFLSLLFFFYFWLGPRPICLPIFSSKCRLMFSSKRRPNCQAQIQDQTQRYAAQVPQACSLPCTKPIHAWPCLPFPCTVRHQLFPPMHIVLPSGVWQACLTLLALMPSGPWPDAPSPYKLASDSISLVRPRRQPTCNDLCTAYPCMATRSSLSAPADVQRAMSCLLRMAHLLMLLASSPRASYIVELHPSVMVCFADLATEPARCMYAPL